MRGAILPCGREVVLEESADYAVWFTIDAREADCVTLEHNGCPVPGGKYQKNGMAIIHADCGDKLSLCVSGDCGFGPNCGCESVTASLLILKLGPKKLHCTHCPHEEKHCCCEDAHA